MCIYIYIHKKILCITNIMQPESLGLLSLSRVIDANSLVFYYLLHSTYILHVYHQQILQVSLHSISLYILSTRFVPQLFWTSLTLLYFYFFTLTPGVSIIAATGICASLRVILSSPIFIHTHSHIILNTMCFRRSLSPLSCSQILFLRVNTVVIFFGDPRGADRDRTTLMNIDEPLESRRR